MGNDQVGSDNIPVVVCNEFENLTPLSLIIAGCVLAGENKQMVLYPTQDCREKPYRRGTLRYLYKSIRGTLSSMQDRLSLHPSGEGRSQAARPAFMDDRSLRIGHGELRDCPDNGFLYRWVCLRK